MTFAAPLWLLGLLPWSAVVIYLIWGRRPRVDVPFLALWPKLAEGIRVRRRATPPPVALALAILAMLLAILAAGRPVLRGSWAGVPVDVILDRGYTMSARGTDERRIAELLATARPAIQRVSPYGEKFPCESVPEHRDADLAPTALDTRAALNAALRRALGRDEKTEGVVVVLSDQAIDSSDERVIRVTPEKPVRNARIALMSARETPTPQVMVRMRAGAGFGRAILRVSSADQTVEREVSLSANGEDDEFVDLARLGQTIKAELVIVDDQPADDTAWLVREASWPRIEARTPLPAHVQRMLDVYTRQRSPTEASPRVVITTSSDSIDEPSVILAPAVGTGVSIAKLIVVDHPIVAAIKWSDIGSPAVASQSPPAGWTPVVSAGERVLVAAREQPVRAVWIGFDTSEWARSSEFVVFWANVFNWAGAGAERFASHAVGSLEGEWTPVELAKSVAPPEPMLWPGLYRRADGTLRALHAPDVPFPEPRPTDWRERLAQLRESTRGQLQLAPILAAASVMFITLAAWLWKRRRPRGGLEAGVETEPA